MKNCAGCSFRTPACTIFHNIHHQGHTADQKRYFKKFVGAHSGKKAAFQILSNKCISAWHFYFPDSSVNIHGAWPRWPCLTIFQCERDLSCFVTSFSGWWQPIITERNLAMAFAHTCRPAEALQRNTHTQHILSQYFHHAVSVNLQHTIHICFPTKNTRNIWFALEKFGSRIITWSKHLLILESCFTKQ